MIPIGFRKTVTVTASSGQQQIAGDCNQDGDLDLSDAVYKLAFLFQGGPGPVLGAICLDIEDCPQNQGCP